jgi:transposase
MPRAYSLDLRERLVTTAHEEHLTQAALAGRFRVSTGTVSNWLGRVEQTGSVAPKPHGGGRTASVDAPGAQVLTELVRAQSDRTLDELVALYHARTHVQLTRSALWRALKRLGLERKKSR